jgi:hypothetical protein
MFVALLPQVAPNTRGMYELMAMQELAKAIELAPAIDLRAPLAPAAWAAEDVQYLPLVMPTVGDLLLAQGADRYPDRATTCSARCTRHAARLRKRRSTSTPELPSG